jgi:hypothetical protein
MKTGQAAVLLSQEASEGSKLHVDALEDEEEASPVVVPRGEIFAVD